MTSRPDDLLSLALEHHRRNDLSQAEALCQQVLQAIPSHAAALQLLGVISGQRGNHEGAADLFRQAIAANPSVPDYHRNLGFALASLGRLAEAVDSYREALRLKPDSLESRFGLGHALTQLGETDSAIQCFREALARWPTSAEVHYNLGTLFNDTGDTDSAITHLQEAARLKPQFPEALNNLSGLLLRKARFQDAAAYLHKLLALRPDFETGHCNLGLVLHELGEFDAARASYENALKLNPKSVEAHRCLANLGIRVGDLEEARRHYRKMGEVSGDPRLAAVGEAAILERKGKVREAHDRLVPSIESGLDAEDAMILLARIKEQLGGPREAAEILGQVSVTDRNRIRVLFELGKVHDELGEYDQAMQYYAQGNALKVQPFERDKLARSVSRRGEVFSADRIERLPSAENGSSLPIFIVGMPRSGTSLVEQVISSHSLVHGAGELRDIDLLARSLPRVLGTDTPYPECLASLTLAHANGVARKHLDHLRELSNGAERVTDKMPYNFMELGLIHLLFPRARIIHCIRDPLDTCLSCFFQNFPAATGWAFDLGDAGFFHKQYERMMRHWREGLHLPMLEVCYEDLVRDPEPHIRQMLEHCGLEWEEQCLRFHESTRIVNTASYQQVRQPIYTRSVGRWKNYSKHLRPLLSELELDPGDGRQGGEL